MEWCPWCETKVSVACRNEEDVFRATRMGETECQRLATTIAVEEQTLRLPVEDQVEVE